MTALYLDGLQSNISGEPRAIAVLKVMHKGQEYDWQVYIPEYVQDLPAYLNSITSWVGQQIDAKEAEWGRLEPKTVEIEDPITGEKMAVPVSKSEVVRPDIPDYYAKRRNEYPSLGDQLDALWKGGDAAASMVQKIQDVKNKYPKV